MENDNVFKPILDFLDDIFKEDDNPDSIEHLEEKRNAVKETIENIIEIGD